MVATRDEGLRRLETFLPYAGREYARFRNFDDGPGRHVHVSTPRRGYDIDYCGSKSLVPFLNDITSTPRSSSKKFWRTYWKGWLELRPGI